MHNEMILQRKYEMTHRSTFHDIDTVQQYIHTYVMLLVYLCMYIQGRKGEC